MKPTMPTRAEVAKRLWEHREREKCRVKKKYFSEGIALGAAEHFNEHNVRTRRSSAKSSAYKCPWCGFWHLTTGAR